jgi:hypothetical protein
MTTITRGWPPARRAAQAARCRATRPWRHATGPRTAAGKAICARNGYKHGFRSAAYTQLTALLRWQRRTVRAILTAHAVPRFPVNFPSFTLIPDKSLANILSSFKRLQKTREHP